ncbi:MAG TPA: hypothetical protein VHZ76_06390 [Gammaproteobacteria bacterium]|nr:hypothetical protein [Gammaproteobacteria bacterium]
MHRFTPANGGTILITGTAASGKTALITRFNSIQSNQANKITLSSIQASPHFNTVIIKTNNNTWICIRDHNLENSRAVIGMCLYQNINAIILTFDLNDKKNFENTITQQLNLINIHIKSKGYIPIMLVGTKSDLVKPTDHISTKEVAAFLMRFATANPQYKFKIKRYYETSTLSDKNINDVFMTAFQFARKTCSSLDPKNSIISKKLLTFFCPATSLTTDMSNKPDLALAPSTSSIQKAADHPTKLYTTCSML